MHFFLPSVITPATSTQWKLCEAPLASPALHSWDRLIAPLIERAQVPGNSADHTRPALWVNSTSSDQALVAVRADVRISAAEQKQGWQVGGSAAGAHAGTELWRPLADGGCGADRGAPPAVGEPHVRHGKAGRGAQSEGTSGQLDSGFSDTTHCRQRLPVLLLRTVWS